MAEKLHDEQAFSDLLDEFSDYIKNADNVVEILQTGADAFVKDLKALPSPRSKIHKSGYTHLLDTFASRKEGSQVLVGWGKYYGPILEEGSIKMKARSHFWPLWKRNQEKYYNKMINKLNGG